MPNRSVFALALLLASCAPRPTAPVAPINAAAIERHVEILASDAYGGRAPGTAGETKTVGYIVAALEKAGLQPGNGTSWFQDVPLVEVAPSRAALLTVSGAKGGAAFEWGEDALLDNARAGDDARLDRSELIFAGYGLTVAERGWDDFAGVDLSGKTVVMLGGIPHALKDVATSATTAAKIAAAAKRGAAGALVILPSEGTDEQWAAQVAAARRRDLRLDGGSRGAVVEGRLRHAAGERLFAASGDDFSSLVAAAGRPGFKPVALGSRATVSLDGAVRRFPSKNVIGVLPGAKRPDEYVLFLAHWDHLGRCAPEAADAICNGAVDNASGIGGLIELARAFAAGERPDRSILFLATTAEEAGLIGGQYFVDHPPVPLAQIVGGLGADTIAAGTPADVVILGQGLSPQMDSLIAAAARTQKRRVAVSPASADFFPRSDHYPFARAGVPVLIATSIFAPGSKTATDKYFAEAYHRPADEYRAELGFEAAAADIDLAYRVGLRLANSRAWPAWKAGSEYAAARAMQR
jgi:hypothetical protein